MAKHYRYFAYSHDTGFDRYETADEARKAAEESLDGYRDSAADDGWSDEVDSVCWGEVKQETVEKPMLAKHQKCGCVVCTCSDERRCQGCGAKWCGSHPVSDIPDPVFERINDYGDYIAEYGLRDVGTFAGA